MVSFDEGCVVSGGWTIWFNTRLVVHHISTIDETLQHAAMMVM